MFTGALKNKKEERKRYKRALVLCDWTVDMGVVARWPLLIVIFLGAVVAEDVDVSLDVEC